jgi:Flp pilus assembly protein TadG
MIGAFMIRKVREFGTDDRGNIAMLFGLTLIPMLGAAGAAIDYSRASAARSTISAAADAGALAAAAKPGTPAEREAAARSVFTSNIERSGFLHPVTVRYTNLVEDNVNKGFRVEAESRVPMIFGWALGTFISNQSAAAEAKSAENDPIELTFVLDTTASMEGDRIANLKTAVNTMLDDMTSRAAAPDKLKVGVVPFAQYVNVGLGYRNAPWINVPADYQVPVSTVCQDIYDQVGTTNCRPVSYPADPTMCVIDGRERRCPNTPRPARTENVCDPVYSKTPRNACWQTGGEWIRWNGCVGSRAYPLNTRDSDYGTRIPGIMNVTCASPIQNLTTDIASIRSTVNGLITSGETYLPSGLIWGKRMLSPGEPLAASASRGARKVIVLVTDGKNTKSPNYPEHNNSDEAVANQLTRETCTNIANDVANPIRVYTVAFEMDGLQTKSILQDCARATGGEFFDALDTAKLRTAFQNIAKAIFTVRLTQ